MGEKGLQGPSGLQGLQGPKGEAVGLCFIVILCLTHLITMVLIMIIVAICFAFRPIIVYCKKDLNIF